jgi:hypothetical protein
MLRRFGRAPKFIAVIEIQKVTGMAHLHVVLDQWINQLWVKESWQAVGGGQHVDIRYKDVHRTAAYMSKYLAKDMLLSGPRGSRRVTTSRSINLDEKKPSDYTWVVQKSPIDRLYFLYADLAQDVTKGGEGEIETFNVRE